MKKLNALLMALAVVAPALALSTAEGDQIDVACGIWPDGGCTIPDRSVG